MPHVIWHAYCCRDGAAGTEQHQHFLVSQRRGPPQLLAMASDLSKQFQVPLIAWGAVAADVTPAQSAAAGSSSQSSSESVGTQAAPGRAFCFLPLPALTSLPVHINGFFELSSNRCEPTEPRSCCSSTLQTVHCHLRMCCTCGNGSSMTGGSIGGMHLQ
jgi:hypothetical protein